MSIVKLHEKGIFQLIAIVLVVGFFIMLSEILKPVPVEQGLDSPLADAAQSLDAKTVKARQVVAETVPWQDSLSLTGTVRSLAEIDIAPLVSGRIVRVSRNFREGAVIKAGETLFEIERVDYELALENTRAEVAAAESDLKRIKAEAQIAINEWKGIFPERPITDLAARRPQIAAATARLESARAARSRAELNLSRTVVSAPFDGRIVRAGLDTGQVVNANSSVGRAYDTSNLEVVAPVRVDELERIQRGTSSRVRLVNALTGSEVGFGTIERSKPVLDDRSRMSAIYISPDDPARLVPGSFLELTVTVNEGGRAWAMPDTVMQDQDHIWVVEGGKLQRKKVAVLERDNGRVIVSGLSELDDLVEPLGAASPGQPVMMMTGTAQLDNR